MTIRISWPIRRSAAGSAPATSASPPVLIKGATSAAAYSMFIDTTMSHIIIEVVLGAHPPPHAEDRGRDAMGIELHIVARAVPEIARVGQEIVHLVGLMPIDPQLIKRQIDPAGLGVI